MPKTKTPMRSTPARRSAKGAWPRVRHTDATLNIGDQAPFVVPREADSTNPETSRIALGPMRERFVPGDGSLSARPTKTAMGLVMPQHGPLDESVRPDARDLFLNGGSSMRSSFTPETWTAPNTSTMDITTAAKAKMLGMDDGLESKLIKTPRDREMAELLAAVVDMPASEKQQEALEAFARKYRDEPSVDGWVRGALSILQDPEYRAISMMPETTPQERQAKATAASEFALRQDKLSGVPEVQRIKALPAGDERNAAIEAYLRRRRAGHEVDQPPVFVDSVDDLIALPETTVVERQAKVDAIKAYLSGRLEHGRPPRSWLEKSKRLRATLERMLATEEARIVAELVEREVKDWFNQPPILQRCDESRMHELRTHLRKKTFYVADEDSPVGVPDHIVDHVVRTVLDNMPPPFIVQNDWAKPFETAGDYAGGEIKLPFDETCFEFRVTGRHVIVVASIGPNHLIGGSFFVEIKTNTWFLIAETGFEKPAADMRNVSVFDLIASQIKAICVALDAEVAEHELVRAPYAENRSRAKRGLAPLRDFHVVKLSRRSRPTRMPEGLGTHGLGTRKRMHFRRGHDRHYQTHTTWIKWQLVGDPDLGFIEKEYRL